MRAMWRNTTKQQMHLSEGGVIGGGMLVAGRRQHRSNARGRCVVCPSCAALRGPFVVLDTITACLTPSRRA